MKSSVPSVPASGYEQLCRIRAPAARVQAAIGTLAGLRGWWTPLVSGAARRGGVLRFEFLGVDEYILMRVDEFCRAERMSWTCLEHSAIEEWKNTRLIYEITPAGATASQLQFRHAGLVPALACYSECSAGWAHFLSSLNAWAETGRGTPFVV